MTTPVLKIVCLNKVIILKNGNNINLEIKFNLSEKCREWEHIGNFLYRNQDFSVTVEQFDYILKLLEHFDIPYSFE